MPQLLGGGRWLLPVALGAIALATLIPNPEAAPLVGETSLWCLVCGSFGLADVILNVVLFLPLGVALHGRGASLWKSVALGFLTSLSIELLQLLVVPGRDAGVSDVVTNTLGTLVGWTIAFNIRTVVSPNTWAAWRWLLLESVVIVGLLGGTSALLRPALLPGTWYRILAPNWPGYSRFDGRVEHVTVGRAVIAADALPNGAHLGTRLLAGDSLEVTFVPGSVPNDLAPLLVLAAEYKTQAAIGQRRRTLEWRLRLGASRLRLHSPDVRLGLAIPSTAADGRVRAWGGFRQGRLYLGARSAAGEQARAELRLSPALGWALLWPFDRALGGEAIWLSAGWLFALLFLLGYHAVWTERVPLALGVAVFAFGVGAGLIPLTLGMPLPQLLEWLSGAAALLAGGSAAVRVRRASIEWAEASRRDPCFPDAP